MTIHRSAPMLLVLASALCAAVMPRAAAQDASPVASPEADCTADLGVVRSTKACVAIVHASPDAPAVDVYLNGEVAVTALVPNSATPFVELPAGDYLVQIVPTGGTADQTVITVDPLMIEAAKAYEVVALNDLVDVQTGEEELRAAVFDVTAYAVPAAASGRPATRMRIVHAVTGGKAIDAALSADDIATPVVDDLEFGNVGPYLETPAGTYRLTVSATWGETLLDEPELALAPDSVVTVYVVLGATATTGLDALVVTTAASRLPAPEASPVTSPTA